MSLQPNAPATTLEQPVLNTATGPGLPPGPATSTNGSSLPKASHVPKGRRGSKLFLILIPAAVLLLVGLPVAAWAIWFRGPQIPTNLQVQVIARRDIQLKVVERGTLEAKDNHDVKCEVKTGNRGAPKIKSVVENGTYVKKGDLLVEIDDSFLQDQATDQKIVRDNAENDKVTAEQAYPPLKAAITVAEQNMKKWVEGDFPQQKHDLEGQIQTANANLQQQDDRASWAGRMVKKGYMTASQEEAEQANLKGDQLALQQLQEKLNVLEKYTDPVNRLTNQAAVDKANNDERAGYAKMNSTLAVFKQQDAKYLDLLDQIKQCKVYAQNEGIVVYAVPEQTRTGSGSTQSIIAQGEPVQAGQKMMSIPDLTHMLVNIRVHEAFINYMRDGLTVSVRVDAVPGKTLKGKVRSVANVAAAPDWMSPDVKVYQAYVEITDAVAELKLKPGLSAVCTIYTEKQAKDVLAVPLPSVVRPQEKGAKPRVYVMTAHGPEARDVETGINDEQVVEITSGLNEGDSVILNPGALLSDKEKKGKQEDEKIVPSSGRPDGKGKGKAGGGAPMLPSGK